MVRSMLEPDPSFNEQQKKFQEAIDVLRAFAQRRIAVWITEKYSILQKTMYESKRIIADTFQENLRRNMLTAEFISILKKLLRNGWKKAV